jgi:hypothetical protein
MQLKVGNQVVDIIVNIIPRSKYYNRIGLKLTEVNIILEKKTKNFFPFSNIIFISGNHFRTRGESKKSVQKNPGPQNKFKLMNLLPKILKKQPRHQRQLANSEIQMVRPCNNQTTTTYPHFPEI